MDSIEVLAAKHIASGTQFDIVFLDGDKRQYTDYYERILQSNLLAPGGLIIADNVLFKGLVSASWHRDTLDSSSSSSSSSDSGCFARRSAASCSGSADCAAAFGLY